MATGEVLSVISDLLQLGLRFGVPWADQMAVLRANNVDPDVYQRVIDDKRTFRDFHKEAQPEEG